jgi:hypothetical protein
MKSFLRSALISMFLVLLCLSCAQSHRGRRGDRRQRPSSRNAEDEGDLQQFVMEKVST